jgi:hypothetical protein
MNYQIPVYSWLSPELAVKIQDHNAAADKAESAMDAFISERNGTLNADPLTIGPDEVIKSRDRLAKRALTAIQLEAEAARSRETLAEEAATEGRLEHDKAQGSLATVERDAVARLASAGLTAESRPHYKLDPAAAQRQIEYLAKQTSEYLTAAAYAAQVGDEVSDLHTRRREAHEAIRELRDQGRRLIAGTLKLSFSEN